MIRSTSILASLITLALSGCATMNEQQCLVSDWRSVGFEDGARGRPVETIGSYRQACTKHGVSPDLESYRSGHAEGVESFCQPVKGFNYGRSGTAYRGVCPADLEYSFLAAYNEGRQLHQLEAALRTADSQIAQRKRALESIRAEIADTEAALIAEGVSAPDRIILLNETKELAREHGIIEAEIVELERDRVLRAEALFSYRETLAYDF
ncbi:MAG: DUF2799 domain-containing protein [Gammaproteobacteria bacterium]|nr:DUF2799 domain-containing protein [Gammaproteobacteria bacterium]